VEERVDVAEGDWSGSSKPSCGSMGGDGGIESGWLTVG